MLHLNSPALLAHDTLALPCETKRTTCHGHSRRRNGVSRPAAASRARRLRDEATGRGSVAA